MFLDIVGTCSDFGIIGLVRILKNILNIIQIIGPILSIIALSVVLVKMFANPEDDKLKKKLFNSILALFLLFIVPVLVNAFIYILDDSFVFSTCWNYADKEIKLDSSYINNSKGKPSKVLSDRNDFEDGDERGPNSANITKRIFIGDSRTVHMYAHITGDWDGSQFRTSGPHVVGNDIFICQSGEGLAWMKDTGMPAAKKYMSNGTALIILMGVNDLYNLNEYLNYMNSNYNEWSNMGVAVYFDSVNPCKGDHNNKIISFNSGLKRGLNQNIKYIDSYSNLVNTGYKTTDGLHYDKDTSYKIYNYIKSNL